MDPHPGLPRLHEPAAVLGALRHQHGTGRLRPRARDGGAIRDALAKVAGANVLTNVSVSVRVEQYLLFQRICAVVVGDAGRI
jgi:hypothetical protein